MQMKAIPRFGTHMVRPRLEPDAYTIMKKLHFLPSAVQRSAQLTWLQPVH